MFTINPISALEAAAVGYFLAVAVQMLLSLWYSRLGRKVLLSEDRWTLTYFVLTGLSWIVAVAFATYESLPLADALSLHQLYWVSSILVFLLVAVLLRNRRQKPLQQSFPAVMFFSLCIAAGAYVGCVERFRNLFR